MGWTRIGKGNKVMALSDKHGRPIALHVAPAHQSENALALPTVQNHLTEKAPQVIGGDRGYDSQGLYEEFKKQGYLLVTHHLRRRAHPFQDKRRQRRLKRRYVVERLFAWMKNYRRLRIRWETKIENFAGFVMLANMLILFKAYL